MKTVFDSNVYSLISEIKDFQYRIQSIDRIWEFIFPDRKEKYHHLCIVQYHERHFISQIDGKLCMLDVIPNESVKPGESFGSRCYEDYSHDPAKGWNDLITDARKWLKVVKANWIKANKQVIENYPIDRRKGIVPHSLVRALISDISRIDQDFGKAKSKKFIKLVEGNYFHDDKKTVRKTMTANEYFHYCKIAYLAGKRKDDFVEEKLSGREMYERYADGRDNGLLELEGDSEQEFADWIDGKSPKKGSGGILGKSSEAAIQLILIFGCADQIMGKKDFK